MRRSLLFLFLFLLLLPGVLGAGVCELDKYDYHPTETAFFRCSCTLPNEENVAGSFTWVNSTNHILQNTSANSGLCRTEVFFSTYFFPIGSNFSGNVTFNTTDAAWANPTDVVSDDFNVSGGNAIDCSIFNVTSNEPSPGDTAVVKFNIRDAISLEDLLNVKCSMSVYNVDGQPIYVHRDGISGDHFEVSTTTGEVYFHHVLTENIWERNQTLEAEFHCSCLNNVNDTESLCYYEINGTAAGYKVCTATTPLVLYGGDNRVYNVSWGIALLVIGILFFFMLLANTFKESKKWFHQSVRLLLIFFCVWISVISGSFVISYANSIQASDAVVATAQSFYGVLVYFAWIFTFLLVLYFIYEVFMAFRIEKQRKSDEILGK